MGPVQSDGGATNPAADVPLRPNTAGGEPAAPRRLYQIREGAMLSGVCTGFARYMGVDVTLVRVVWLVIALTAGVGFIAYIVAWIVMPKNAPRVKCDAVEGYGGKIAFCEPTVSARKAMCAKLQAETGAVLVHPYDDDRIIAGQATAAKELLDEVPDLDAILAPVSGGGLLSGSCLSARHMRPEIRMFGCEPAAANDAYLSMKTGELQTIEATDTIADGLRASLAPRTFAILQRELAGVLLVSEAEIIETMRLIWERMKIVVEPSSSIVLAPLLQAGGAGNLQLAGRADAQPAKIGLILSGGNVDMRALPFRAA